MIIAVDTGGTKTLIALFDTDGTIVSSHKFPTPKSQKEYVTTVRSHITSLYANQPVKVISIAVPGIVQQGHVARFANLPWEDFAIAEEFADTLPGVPVFVENDANLAGVGEAHVLSPIPRSLLYVTISTGIGTGIVENGKIVSITRHLEGGHIITPFEGELQNWETFAAGSAIYRDYNTFAKDITDPEIWRAIAKRLAPGFGALIPVTQPDIIVVGGSVGTYLDRFEDFLRAELEPVLHPITPFPKMIKSNYPEEAVIYGCYYDALNRLDRR